MTQAEEIQDAFAEETTQGQIYNQAIPPVINEKGSTSSPLVCPAHIYIDKGMERIEGKVDNLITKVDEMDGYILVDKDRKQRKNTLLTLIQENFFKICTTILAGVMLLIIGYATVL